MKNNMFKKILALFLTGTLLAGVGCKDYDDDIDTINKKLDNLETVTIADLQKQIDGIRTTVEGLEKLTGRIETLETKLDGTGSLSSQLAALTNQLKAYADKGDQSTLNTADRKFALQTALAQLESDLKALIAEKLDKDNAVDLKTVQDEIAREIQALKTDATWLGSEIEQYLTTKNYTETVSQKASEDILTQIQTENSAYQEAIKALITEATGGKIGKADLDDELAGYLAKVDALLERVAVLEKRIQSLVYVPQYADGKVIFTGAQYFVWDAAADADPAAEPVRYMLREGGSQLATLTFRVTPAALVGDIANKEALSMVTEEVKTRAAAATGFEIEEVAVTNAAKGEFTVSVSTAYDYAAAATESKTQLVALHVDGSQIALPEGQAQPYDIDYTTDFIVTEQQAGNPDVGANFVLVYDKNAAKAEEEGYVPDYADYAAAASELKYTATEPLALLPGYRVMYKDGEKFISLKEAAAKYAWTTDVEALLDVTGEMTVSPEEKAASYELKDRALTIKTTSTELIGNKVTAKFRFAFAGDAHTRTIQKDATHTVTIITDGPEYTAEKSELVWNYGVAEHADANAKNVYAAAPVQLTDSKLSAVEYNNLKTMTPTVTVENDKGIVAEVKLTGTANRDSDPQYVGVTLKGDLSASAEYTVKAVYEMPAGNRIIFNCPVTVTGVPAGKEIASDPILLEYNGTKFDGYKAIENYAGLIWNELTADEQAQYVDEDTFTAMIHGLAATSTAPTPRLRVGTGTREHLFVDFNAATEPGKANDLVCEIKAAWGTIATFKAAVTMTVPNLEVTYGSLYNNGNPKVATTYNNETGLALDNLKLGDLIYYQGDVSNVKVVFDFDEATKAKMTDENKAEISSDNKLSWGSWNGLSLGIEAQLMYGALKIGAPVPLTPAIKDPIKSDFKPKAHELKVSKDAEDNINLHKLLSLMDLNDKDVFTDTGIRQDIVEHLYGTALFGELQTSANVDRLVEYDRTKGTLKVLKSDFVLPSPITVKIPVTFNYSYTDEFKNPPRTATITVTISQK